MDVIAALASPPGEGAIGVIELFGDGAVELVAGIFQSPRGAVLKDSSADDLFYGRIIEGTEVIDEVMVKITSRDPDHLEINCHGGAVPHTAIMALLVRLGTRKCPWRELFSTAGRAEGLDAVQIEAGVRLPGALTLTTSRMLVVQYNGALSRAAREDDLLDLRDELLQLAPYGLALCEPLKLVVAGRPNVGKSTLTNALLGVERVITSPTPGTTRDAVASFLDIDGVPLELFDTAGLGSARGELEELGEARALETVASADIVLCVIDGSRSVSNKDKRLLELCCGKKAVAVISKSDLPRTASIDKSARFARNFHRGSAPLAAACGDLSPIPPDSHANADSYAFELDLPESMPLVEVAATQGTGLEELKQAVLRTLFSVVPPDVNRPIPFTTRQIKLLTQLNESNVTEIASSLRYV